MSQEELWKQKEEEYLRLLREADQRYRELVRERKEAIRNTNLVWIGWLVIFAVGFYFF
jgi:hypothetical protein